MKKRLFYFLICIIFFSITTRPVYALIINICPACSYTTIQSAINNASTGDLINVSSGNYVEDLVINKTLELQGAGSSLTTIKGIASIDVALFPLAIPNIEILADGVKIHDFSIESSNYSSGNYSSGMVIEASNVEVYSNSFKTRGAGNSGEISQAIQTYHRLAIPGVDISGLNIHNNIFTNLSTSTAGYEGIWINLDDGIGGVNMQSNLFNGEIFRAITTERNKTNIKNNIITTSLTPNLPGLGGWQGINVGGANEGALSSVTIINNTINNSDLGKGFVYGIKIGYATTSKFNNVSIKKNNIKMTNDAGVYVKYSSDGVAVNENDLSGNNFGVKSDDVLNNLDATYNWWGSCTGPAPAGSGSNASSNVSYNPWLGACIKNKAISRQCILEGDSITLYANISSLVCIGNVIFSVSKNGTWQNYTGVASNGVGNYSYSFSGLTGNQNVFWTVYVDDCYGHLAKNGIEGFYVNKKTSLSINPNLPDGLNNWYVTEPIFSLLNFNATQLFYRWDGSGSHLYNLPFNLTYIPNPPSETAGILKLTWWSNLSCNRIEPEQNQTFYIDLTSPMVENLVPADYSIISNKNPLISAVMNDIYGENSGINKDSIMMKIDDINVTNSIVKSDLSLIKTRVSYNSNNLSEGWHFVELQGQDNAGRMFYKSWNFSINTSSGFDLNVFSPINRLYDKKQIIFEINTTSLVSKIEYIDNSAIKSRWRSLCINCKSYERRLSFSDGEHNVIVRAADNFGNSEQKEINFSIDSIAPRIVKIEPRKNSVINGSRFYVKYSEDNLKSIALYYGNLSQTKTNCDSGRNKECSFSINLTDYDNMWIDYYFELNDSINSKKSQITSVFIDNLQPSITIYSPSNTNYSRRVLFNITISEYARLEYSDNSGRFNILCVSCNKFSRDIQFVNGNHFLSIHAIDKAGNSDIQNKNFNIP